MSLQSLVNTLPEQDKNKHEYHIMLSKIGSALQELTLENWLSLCENESELVFQMLQTFDFNSLYENNGWYMLYKNILVKHPEYICHVPKYKAPIPQEKVKWGWENNGLEMQRLTQEQSDELHSSEFAKIKEYEKEYEKKHKDEMLNNSIHELLTALKVK
jgi:hypothetical protein